MAVLKRRPRKTFMNEEDNGIYAARRSMYMVLRVVMEASVIVN